MPKRVLDRGIARTKHVSVSNEEHIDTNGFSLTPTDPRMEGTLTVHITPNIKLITDDDAIDQFVIYNRQPGPKCDL